MRIVKQLRGHNPSRGTFPIKVRLTRMVLPAGMNKVLWIASETRGFQFGLLFLMDWEDDGVETPGSYIMYTPALKTRERNWLIGHTFHYFEVMEGPNPLDSIQ